MPVSLVSSRALFNSTFPLQRRVHSVTVDIEKNDVFPELARANQEEASSRVVKMRA